MFSVPQQRRHLTDGECKPAVRGIQTSCEINNGVHQQVKVSQSLQPVKNTDCSSFILVELGLQRSLALVRILEILILAFINFLLDVTARSRGGKLAGARSALTLGLTADRAVARVRCAVARPGQNPPKWLPGDCMITRCPVSHRAIARCPVSSIFGFILSIIDFHVLPSFLYTFLHHYKSEIH
ncbi:hypothetical protein PIB30_076952 [Stylosanthes scabra]|uniref:Uncharacterized protein n=1 Tax=Stylosanthes scabra TaxID=79078 RepID=A0ABU6YN12_9FABA|nr:hypothetical protein [Stylosanthes scabra]